MSQKRKKHSMSADVKPEEAGTVFLKCAKELVEVSHVNSVLSVAVSHRTHGQMAVKQILTDSAPCQEFTDSLYKAAGTVNRL